MPPEGPLTQDRRGTLAILSSGGDAPGMNAAIGAATKLATGQGWQVLGVQDGYEGLMAGCFRPLGPRDVDDTWHRGGTLLGSARSARFRTAEGRAEAAAELTGAGVDALMVIGGNGSLTGARLLLEEHDLCVVGVPASIDNDIACTSFAVGVDTALNTIMEACDRISDTASSHRRVFVVEVMGRECGYLAMAAAIATAADAVLFREQGKSEDAVVSELRGLIGRAFTDRGKKRVLIITAEGVAIDTSRLVHRLQTHADTDVPGVGVRATVLGHVVRGGNPSYRDRLIAARLANGAAFAAMRGISGVMAGWEPHEAGGLETPDSSVRLFGLDEVLTQTTALLDGSHPATRRRVRLLEAVQGVLPL